MDTFYMVIFVKKSQTYWIFSVSEMLRKEVNLSVKATEPIYKWSAIQSSKKSESSGFIYSLRGDNIPHIYFTFWTHDKNTLFTVWLKLHNSKLIYQECQFSYLFKVLMLLLSLILHETGRSNTIIGVVFIVTISLCW